MTYSRQNLERIAYQRQLIEDLEVLENECPLTWAHEIYRLKIHEAKVLYKELHPNHLEFKSEEEFYSQGTKPITCSFSTVHRTTGADKTADTFYFHQVPKSQIGKLLVKCGLAKIRNLNDRGVI